MKMKSQQKELKSCTSNNGNDFYEIDHYPPFLFQSMTLSKCSFQSNILEIQSFSAGVCDWVFQMLPMRCVV